MTSSDSEIFNGTQRRAVSATAQFLVLLAVAITRENGFSCC